LLVSEVPQEGTPVETRTVKRAGPYLLGPTLGSSPVKSIVQCLARRDGTDDFYTLKVQDCILCNILLLASLRRKLYDSCLEFCQLTCYAVLRRLGTAMIIN
jgi:hypothetical protein